MADTHDIQDAIEIPTISRSEFNNLIPATAINTSDLAPGVYNYVDKIVGKYNTKYQYENADSGDIFNLTIKALSSFRIDDKLMLKALAKAEDYTLAPSFTVVKKAVVPDDADKRYPMYCFAGYTDFQKTANEHQIAKTNVPQEAYDTLYATDILDEHKDRYYRKIHITDPLLEPKQD